MGWCTLPWSISLYKMDMFGHFLRAPRNVERFCVLLMSAGQGCFRSVNVLSTDVFVARYVTIRKRLTVTSFHRWNGWLHGPLVGSQCSYLVWGVRLGTKQTGSEQGFDFHIETSSGRFRILILIFRRPYPIGSRWFWFARRQGISYMTSFP